MLDIIVTTHLSTLLHERPDIYRHSLETARDALVISEVVYGVSDNPLVRAAALLHDYGKLSIPPEILDKIGPLTERETKIMHTHVDFGASHFSTILSAHDLVLPILQHHELPGGSGYPNHLVSNDILTVSKIINLADRFSALTEDRTYRPAMAPEFAASMLHDDAIAFFPLAGERILDELVRHLRYEYSIATLPARLMLPISAIDTYLFQEVG